MPMIFMRGFFAFLLYSVFLIILFEGTARLLLEVPYVSNRIGLQEDTAWRRAWVERHRRTGTEAYYGFDVYDPTKGWISKSNIRDMQVFGDRFLNTNSRGLRGIREYSYAKDPGKLRILVLGDSFTFGDEVSDDETFSHFLERMIPNSEVINMGVHGYGHDQMLIILREEGKKYNPDIVILGFIYRDMDRNLLQFRDFAKPRFEIRQDTLEVRGVPVPQPDDVLKWDWAKPRIYDIWSFVWHKLLVKTGAYQEKKTEITIRILDEINSEIQEMGAISVFVYLVPAWDLSSEANSTPFRPKGEQFLLSYCAKNGSVMCFSSLPHFQDKLKQGLRFKARGHWDAFGHFTVAQAIYEALLEEGLVQGRNSHGD